MNKLHGLFVLVLAFVLLIGVCTAVNNVDTISGDNIFHPWRLNASQHQLDDLKYRLEHALLPTELEDVKDWSYGVPLNFMKYMVKFWREKYDFREREAILNRKMGLSGEIGASFPSGGVNLPSGQYITTVNGSRIHFLHYVSSNSSAIPLIIVHGWPGSVLECVNMVPSLSSQFHIVCPSIPGYFYSDPPTKKGTDTSAVARQFSTLMNRLHYRHYLASGGDWGAEIARWIGIQDSNCVAVHMSMVIAQIPLTNWSHGIWEFITSIRAALELWLPSYFFDEKELQHLDRMKNYGLEGSGYLIQHSTTPQTTSFAFSDSPIGLAAYIWEKYHLWSDLPTSSSESKGKNGASSGSSNSDARARFPILSVYSEEFLIDTVMFYWLPNAISSSMRLYKETIPKLMSEALPFQYKPTAISAFKDIVISPKSWARNYLNIVQWRDHSEGGHWPSLEAPATLTTDIIDFTHNISAIFKSGFQMPKQEPDVLGFSSEEL